MSIKIKFFNVLNNRYEIDVGHQEPILPKAQRSGLLLVRVGLLSFCVHCHG